MDPYSHTPGQGGARQPGLTGQVKEDFLCRFGELGVMVANGQIIFRPHLLRRAEFLTARAKFEYFDVAGQKRRLPLAPGELAFTYCQIPVIYRLAARNAVKILSRAAAPKISADLTLDTATSQECFARTGHIRRIEVSFNRSILLP
jgi:hypothetical protein